MNAEDLFDLEQTIAKQLLLNKKHIWECLSDIHDYILELGKSLDKERFEQKDKNIWIAKSAKIAPTAIIEGPAIIDDNAEIRHSAFIRGNAIVGKNSVIGNSTELKNCILFNKVEVPHFNYVGDSILGYEAHLGAGTIISNLKSDKTNIIIDKIDTNMKKVGAFVGDGVQVGCNSVLNPGTIIGKNTSIYPLSCVRGIINKDSIYKNKNEIIKRI